MLRRTKNERLLKVITILEKNKNYEHILGTWVDIINNSLTDSKVSFRGGKAISKCFKILNSQGFIFEKSFKVLKESDDFVYKFNFYTYRGKIK